MCADPSSCKEPLFAGHDSGWWGPENRLRRCWLRDPINAGLVPPPSNSIYYAAWQERMRSMTADERRRVMLPGAPPELQNLLLPKRKPRFTSDE